MPQLTLNEATQFFSKFYGGVHHIPNGSIIKYGSGWSVNNNNGSLSSYDSNDLTRLVVMAHDECIRVELIPARQGVIKIAIWKRERVGNFMDKHPTLEHHIQDIRKALSPK